MNTTLSTCGFGIIDWDKDNQNAIDNGWLIKADSIEELAQKIRDTHAAAGAKLQKIEESIAALN